MSLHHKIYTAQFINHWLMLFGAIYVLYTGSWYLLLMSLAIWQVQTLLEVVVYHRMVAHNSFKTYEWLKRLLIFVTIWNTRGPTIIWAGIHRWHHANSEKENDPHSPYIDRHDPELKRLGFKQALKIWFGFLDHETVPKTTMRDLFRDKYQVWIMKNYFKILVPPVIALAIYDPILMIFVYAIPAALGLHLAALGTVVSHIHGYQNFDTKDNSKNSWFVSLLSWGDGWHNNHHRYPSSWTTKVKSWELDPASWFIRLIKTS